MKYLVEFYDRTGRCFKKFYSEDAISALTETAMQCEIWRGLGFKNASCYLHGVEQWNLEIKET